MNVSLTQNLKPNPQTKLQEKNPKRLRRICMEQIVLLPPQIHNQKLQGRFNLGFIILFRIILQASGGWKIIYCKEVMYPTETKHWLFKFS